MRIVLTHPFCWPHVRRGTERNIDQLGMYLTGRGHDVTVVSTGPEGIEAGPSGTRILHRPLTVPFMSALRIQPAHTFFFRTLRSLRALESDVIHSFFVSDALAAACVRGRGRTVLQLNGIAIPGVSCRRWLPPEGLMFREALHRADHRIVCSQFIRELVLRHYRIDAEVIPPLVDVESYEPGPGPRDGRPTLLSVADFSVRRKGARALVDAFRLVKSALPDAVLRLSGNMPALLARELLRGVPASIAGDIEILGLGRVEDLPGLYREATVMVLPALREPSGTVMVEAWASGTPVVAARDGGLPEFVTPDVGVLFEPGDAAEETTNVRGLADAILAGVALGNDPATRLKCRSHARRYSWAALGPRIEAAYLGA